MKLRTFTQHPTNPAVQQETPRIVPLWKVELHLERIFPRALSDAADLVFARIARHAPRYPPVKYRSPGADAHLAVLNLSDAHFGKLAWAPEAGADYDLRIAERVYTNAVADLLTLARPYRVERIILPIGNDFFHIDNQGNTTTAGTRVDTDGRYAKIIDVGEFAVIRAVEQLVQLAPVDVVWVPGNHDTHASFHLARMVHAWFRREKHVAVNFAPDRAKRVRYHDCLLGFTHGDKIPIRDLPDYMAQAWRKDFGETTCHEWFRGHDHRQRKHLKDTTDTFKGVVVRTMPALGFTDAWHADNGYVGPLTAAESYLYHRANGCVANFVARTRVD